MTSARQYFASKGALSIFAIAAATAAGLSAAQAGNNKGAGAQWLSGGVDLNNSRTQATTSITPTNVGKLSLKWTFQTGGDVTATPAVVYSSNLRANVVYFPDFAGNFYAVNGTTGQQIWTQKVSSWTGITGDFSRDDPVYYTGNNGNGDGGHAEIILGNQAGSLTTYTNSSLQGSGAWVIAVDPDTGNLIWKTQVETFPTGVITGSPVIYKGTVYVGVATAEEFTAATPGYPCCISRGSVVALDAKKGTIQWKTYMVPDNGGRTGGYSGGSVWDSTPVVDPDRNSLYVGTGNNFSVPATVAPCLAQTPTNKACTDPTDYFDSVVSLDLKTGAVKWAARALYYDAWNVSCIIDPGIGNCPSPTGPDYDFGGAGPNMLVTSSGKQLIGAGEKSGYYYALNPDTGAVAWSSNVGPGSTLGGIQWGSAFDSTNVYVQIGNANSTAYTLQPSGPTVNSGSWSAIDPTTGAIKWQTGTPGACTTAPAGTTPGCLALGPVSAAGGVVFGGSMDKNAGDATMFALNGATGAVLWTYTPGSTVIAGPAIVDNWVYWGAGYRRFGLGTPNNYLYAFSVPAQ